MGHEVLEGFFHGIRELGLSPRTGLEQPKKLGRIFRWGKKAPGQTPAIPGKVGELRRKAPGGEHTSAQLAEILGGVTPHSGPSAGIYSSPGSPGIVPTGAPVLYSNLVFPRGALTKPFSPGVSTRAFLGAPLYVPLGGGHKRGGLLSQGAAFSPQAVLRGSSGGSSQSRWPGSPLLFAPGKINTLSIGRGRPTPILLRTATLLISAPHTHSSRAAVAPPPEPSVPPSPLLL